MSHIRKYHGTRLVGGTHVGYDITTSTGVKYGGGPLVPSKPIGFDWGNMSEAARDLAVAIIRNATGSAKLAESVADAFLKAHVSMWHGNWEIASDDILRWLARLQARSLEAASNDDLSMCFTVVAPLAKGGA